MNEQEIPKPTKFVHILVLFFILIAILGMALIIAALSGSELPSEILSPAVYMTGAIFFGMVILFILSFKFFQLNTKSLEDDE